MKEKHGTVIVGGGYAGTGTALARQKPHRDRARLQADLPFKR